MKGYRLSKHVLNYVQGERSYIKLEWIERTIENPDFVEEVSENEVRLWKRIGEFGNRLLRGGINVERKVVITAFFDRGFRP